MNVVMKQIAVLTYHSVAYRVYENEVSMLVEAVEKISDRHLITDSSENYEIHKRMPKSIEQNLLEMFEQYKNAMQRSICKIYDAMDLVIRR